MARVTVEDCLDNVDNRFQLVLVATKRARQISLGSEPYVEEENDKPTVLALREIAEGHVTREILDEPEQADVLEFISEETTDADGAESAEGESQSEEVSAAASETDELDALAKALQAELASETVDGAEEPEKS